MTIRRGLGHFVPRESFLHRLDPRSKIIGLIVLLTGLFVGDALICTALWCVMTVVLCRASRSPIVQAIRSGRTVRFIIFFTAVLNLFWTPGEVLFSLGPLTATKEGAILAFQMGARLFFLVIFAAILMNTTSPNSFSDALEHLLRPLSYIKVPTSELAMMMTIALRFIPTLVEETDRIVKAQQSRGANFESGGLLKRARSYAHILIPLFVLVFRRAENLAYAMEARCFMPGARRSRMEPLVWTIRESAAIMIAAAFAASAFLLDRYASKLTELF